MAIGKVTKKLATAMTGNRAAHDLLGSLLRTIRGLMGIGLGKSPGVSGERELIGVAAKLAAGSTFRVFDVGANRGEFGELIPDVLRSGPFEVHCFEPSTAAFAMLDRRFGDDSRFVLNPFGLGREVGEATLYWSGPASRTASLSKLTGKLGEDYQYGSEMVHLSSLDAYCLERMIETVHLLKIDVEGHEMDVLAGAEAMLNDGRIQLVSFEFGACHIDTGFHFRDFYRFFRNLEMNIYRLTPSGYLHPLRRYGEILEQYGTTNYVASRLDLSRMKR